MKAAKSVPGKKTLNWNYFYKLLFTRDNLKLVHIACHDKKEHNLQCDPEQYYIPYEN